MLPGARSAGRVGHVVDTHCHLGMIEEGAEWAMEEAGHAGIEWVVDIGMGMAESAAVVQRAAKSSGRIRAAVGLHPNDLGEYAADPGGTLTRLRELASDPNVVAVGETGLDFYRDREPPARQEESFRAHIALATELGKALVIHTREAHADVLRVLDDAGPPERVVMHCFSGDEPYARECVVRGFFCSFAGNLTYKSAEDLRAAARAVPEELLLVETDAPFLAPVPHRGKRNHPALVVHTARALAEARGADHDALASVLVANSGRAFAYSRT